MLLQLSLIKQLGGSGAQRIGDMTLGLSAPWLEFLFLYRFTVSRWANRVLCLFVSYVLRGNHGVLLSGVVRLNHSGSETLWWGFIYPHLDIPKKKTVQWITPQEHLLLPNVAKGEPMSLTQLCVK